MKTAGIICEYNPFHLGHFSHIEKTKETISAGTGDDIAIVCVMSGNFVQRGDLAVFNKQARAKMAILNGADLVIELPTPYVLQSAEGFAKAGVYILDKLGICDHISFGSESGDIKILQEAASAIVTDRAHLLTKEWLETGISYASAQQKAADTLLGVKAGVFTSPNNVLGIEYLKALSKYGSQMKPVTIRRTGGDHDSDTGYSATALRKSFLGGNLPMPLMSGSAFAVSLEEIASGRGPVSMTLAEQAILSRLRALDDYSTIPGTSEGLDKRLKRYATTESSITSILEKVKTKRYTMARIRRMLMCAALGIKAEDTTTPPPYIRILAMNATGMKLLSKARKKTKLPIITKPASVNKLREQAINLFNLESLATDLYVLAYQNENERKGTSEWLKIPLVIE